MFLSRFVRGGSVEPSLGSASVRTLGFARPVASRPVLEVRDLSVRYGTGVQALDRVSLTVGCNEVVGLVGESGAGKSALAMATLGLLPDEAVVDGTCELGGTDMVAASAEERRLARLEQVGAIFQDPMTSLNPTMRVGHQICETAGNMERALSLLAEVGLPDPHRAARQYPHELSGGMRQRAMIAMAVAREPALVVADEPTTALDATVQAQVVRLLGRLREEIGLSMLFVTHDLALAARLADRLVVLYGGRIVEQGPATALLRDPAHPYTAALLASRLTLGASAEGELATLNGGGPDRSRRAAACPFKPRCQHAQPLCEEQMPKVSAAPRHPGSVACHRAAQLSLTIDRGARPAAVAQQAGVRACEASAVPVVEFERVVKGFGRKGDKRIAVDGVSLSIRAGSSLALVGESGCGKTTLLRMAVGLERPDAGRIALAPGTTPQLVFQDAGASLTPWLTVGGLLAERVRALPDAGARVRQALQTVGLDEGFTRRYPDELSGGQRQRVAIARAIIVPPTVLACDEPTSALDVSLAALVINLLRRLRRQLGLALVVVTHDLAVAGALADEVAVMHHGRIVEQGPAAQILEAPSHAHTQELVSATATLGAA